MRQQVILSPEGELGLVMHVTQTIEKYLDADGYHAHELAPMNWFALKFLGCPIHGHDDLWANIGETLADDVEILGEL